MTCTCPLCGSLIDAMPLTILEERGMVVANGKFAILPPREISLLKLLAEQFPRVLSKPAILGWLYQFESEPEIKIIDVFICKIRKKIEPIGVHIDTVWGTGYALRIGQKPNVIPSFGDEINKLGEGD